MIVKSYLELQDNYKGLKPDIENSIPVYQGRPAPLDEGTDSTILKTIYIVSLLVAVPHWVNTALAESKFCNSLGGGIASATLVYQILVPSGLCAGGLLYMMRHRSTMDRHLPKIPSRCDSICHSLENTLILKIAGFAVAIIWAGCGLMTPTMSLHTRICHKDCDSLNDLRTLNLYLASVFTIMPLLMWSLFHRVKKPIN